jgi:pimeloyl-ACP methyl ester carboxylesterase
LAEFRALNTVHRFELAGVEWTYHAGGEGQTLLMLPGGEYRVEAGFEWMLAFQRSRRVIAPTYPTHWTTLAPIVDGVIELLRREGLERVDLLGTSFGGMVAQALVRACPERVANLVLSQTSAPDPAYGKRLRRRLSLVRWVPERVMRWLLFNAIDQTVKDEPESPFWKAHFREIYAAMPGLAKAILLSSYGAIVDFCLNYHYAVDDLAQPMGWAGRILITDAGEDTKVAKEGRERLHALYPGAQTYSFPRAGHALGSARRAEYLSVVLDFLRETH